MKTHSDDSLPTQQCTINVANVDVLASIKGSFAGVVLRHVYRNDTNITLHDMDYTFPIGVAWTIHRVSVRVGNDGPMIRAVIMKKEDAIREYRNALASGKFATTTAVTDHELTTIRISKLKAGELLYVELRCSCVLPTSTTSHGVATRLAIPATSPPLFGVPKKNTHGPVCFFKQPTTVSMANQVLQVDVVAYEPRGIHEMWSPTHPTMVPGVTGPKHGHLKLTNPIKAPTEDIVVFVVPKQQQPIVSFVTETTDDETTLAVAATVHAAQDTASLIMPTDIVFVIDRSGSMSGEKINMARRAIVIALLDLAPKDTVSIVSYSVDVTTLYRTPKICDGNTIKDAIEFVDTLKADGGTMTLNALRAAYAMHGVQSVKPLVWETEQKPATPTTQQEKKNSVVVLVTDGLVHEINASSTTAADALSAAGVRTFVLGVGREVRVAEMASIAHAGGGMYDVALPGDNILTKMQALLLAARTPPIQSVSLTVSEIGAPENMLYPILRAGARGTIAQTKDAHYLSIFKTTTPQQHKKRGYTFTLDIDGTTHIATKGPEENEHSFDKGWLHALIAGELTRELEVSVENTDEIARIGIDYNIATTETHFVFVEPLRKGGESYVSNITLGVERREIALHSASVYSKRQTETMTTQPATASKEDEEEMINALNTREKHVTNLLIARNSDGSWGPSRNADGSLSLTDEHAFHIVDKHVITEIYTQLHEMGYISSNGGSAVTKDEKWRMEQCIVLTMAVVYTLENVYVDLKPLWNMAHVKAVAWLKKHASEITMR